MSIISGVSKNIKFWLIFLIFSILSCITCFLSYFVGDGEVSKEVYRLLFAPILMFVLYLNDFDYNKLFKTVILLSLIGGIFISFEFYLLNFADSQIANAILIAQRGIRGLSDGDSDRHFNLDFYIWDINLIRPNGLFNGPQKSGFLFVIGSLYLIVYYQLILKIKFDHKFKVFLFLFLLFTIFSTSKTAIFALFVLYLFIIPMKRKFSGLLIVALVVVITYLSLDLFINNSAYSMPLNADLDYFNGASILSVLMGSGMCDDDNFASTFKIAGEHFIFRVIISCGLVALIILFINFIIILDKIRSVSKNIYLYLIVLTFFLTFHYSIFNEYFVLMSLPLFVVMLIKLKTDENFV